MARRNSAHEEPAGLRWVKSSASTTTSDSCVELAVADGTVFIRDSKDAEGASLVFRWPAWERFLGSTSEA
ncbi:hypothetical protein Lesp02_16190 [Lentzea sp. NBRC 105346]|nr:hypothetical protein Lesp02_16190 [Lentzea sp. NBRC 105346]